jgi:hypothetical protein
MHQGGKQSPSRELVWVEGSDFAGWGCSECDWVFHSTEWPEGRSLEEIKQNFQTLLTREFESHVCTNSG